MSVATVPVSSEVFAANRATGRIAVRVAAETNGSRPVHVHESGSLRVRFPHCDPGNLNAVIVNTSGGLTGGDRFDLDIDVAAGARLTVTTAAAEKIYRSLGPNTELDVNLSVGAGGTLAWLPQETILFDQSRLRRKIDVDLAADGACLLMAESSIFGRLAMGESVISGYFFDRWRIRVGGALVFADAISLDGSVARFLSERPVAAGGVAIASVVKFPGGEENVTAVRVHQQEFVGEVGVSAWNGVLAVRCVAADDAALRQDLTRVLTVLGGAPLPRLWIN
jgi:urease accessory protein